MSTDEDSTGSPLSPSTPTHSERPEGRQRERGKGSRNAPEQLRHQQSFEARYSSMIQRQIWETTINKDVMDRQLNAYFPFARSASLNKEASDGSHSQLLSPTAHAGGGSGADIKARSLATTPIKQRATTAVCLEKLETLDVADKDTKEEGVKKAP